MKFNLLNTYDFMQMSECLVVGMHENTEFSEELRQLDNLSTGFFTKFSKLENLTGKIGELNLVYPSTEQHSRVIIVGLGKKNSLTFTEYLPILRSLWKTVLKLNITSVDFLLNSHIAGYDISQNIRFAVESLENSMYIYDAFKSDKVSYKLQEISILAPYASSDTKLLEATAVSHGIHLSKDLGNAPGNVCTPSYLAELAKTYAKNAHTTVNIISEKDMKELGMGAYLAVSSGSQHEAFLSIIDYNNASDPNTKPIVLLGKGLTFDAGGVSLKPAASMDEMKYDMCGAATVLGVMRAISELDLPLHVIGMVAACENMIGSTAYKPGDILTTLSGKTVEVLNADAEGRLVLCDSLEYAKKFNPELVIDMATLTGACVVALGHHLSALYANNDELADKLLEAGRRTGDKAWRMPLGEEYAAQLKSTCADIANIGGRFGGSVTAAEFLHFFVGDAYKWAHFDIAGTAWVSGAEKGSTGRPVALLTQFLIDYKC